MENDECESSFKKHRVFAEKPRATTSSQEYDES